MPTKRTATILMSLSMISLVTQAFASMPPEARHEVLKRSMARSPAAEAHAIECAVQEALQCEIWWHRNREAWQVLAAANRGEDSASVKESTYTPGPPPRPPAPAPSRGWR